MALITWNPTLATGHPKIDEQHQALVTAFNDLHAAMKQGKGRDHLGKTLDFLAKYTTEHFCMEERLMEAAEYPGWKEHGAIHESLLFQVHHLVKEFHEGKASLTLPVMDFLEKWLTEHIQGEDMRLAAFLKTKAA